ncbi:hypothetical protein ABDK00_008385 [Niabella insulamsoli]|uniref:hypothetical protein n=1 Tax=Niabella insulamsoli TaxID=3144874 RepID=UPI0031FCDBE1
MRKKYLIPGVGAIALAICLVSFTSSPTVVTDQFWVLKDGATISTDPSDYEPGASPCAGSTEFCGFLAPEDGVSNEPVISGLTEQDLDDLSDNPNDPVNSSGKISYRN